MKKQCQTVILLGMHRSGTSMTAGVLKKLGVHMGKKLHPPAVSNPLGHFENIKFIRLNDRILTRAGGDHLHPPKPEAILQVKEQFQDDIKNLLQKEQRGLWGWKDPRSCLTIELFLPYLINPFFIVCHRESRAVAESLLSRGDFSSIESGISLQEHYEAQIERFFQNNPDQKRLDVYYHKAILDPNSFVNEIINFLKIKVSKCKFFSAISLIKPKFKLNKAAKAIEQVEKWRNIINNLPKKAKRIIFSAFRRDL